MTSRCVLAVGMALGAAFLTVGPVAAFEGFGEASADAAYDRQVRFDVELTGGRPDSLELLIRTPGSDATFVVPVEPNASEATYIWDTSADYITPNTLLTYQWRATEDEAVLLSPEATVRYDDDRPGLDWQSALLGETTVHWYGDVEQQAMRFGELAAVGVEQGESLLATELAGPVDVFVYDSREDFFGALGPTAREWFGAAAVGEIRTIFMSLHAGAAEDLEAAIVHEITHIVFHDATDNPYHEPATWVNEGIASWSELGDGGGAAAFVASQAHQHGLFAFDAISERLPIGDLESGLSYAQSTAMIDLIIDTYGREAIARLAAAYREGASDSEALEAATGVPTDELYASFFAGFGVDQPTPVEPEPIAASDVEIPEPGEVDPGGVELPADSSAEPDPGQVAGGGSIPAWVLILVLLVAVLVAAAMAVAVSRRAARRAAG